MELTQNQSWQKVDSLTFVKSFLVWSFTLTVCLLVVGFPLVVLMAAATAIVSVALQSLLPVSAVLLVTGSMVGANLLAVLLGAAVLTAKGVHPHQVRWLHWLHGEDLEIKAPIFAACPLTCNLAE